MRFSPLLVTALIMKPLRYFFSNYTAAQGFVWNHDPKISTIEIANINDFHGEKIQAKPRILINRGAYGVSKTGLTDNLAESRSIQELRGNSDRVNMVWIQGSMDIVIEAREEGTCELLADMVSHFIVWTRPLLLDTQGFKEFGLDMRVSSCEPDKEDIEKFKITISVPYLMEEHWQVRQEALQLKAFFMNLDPNPQAIDSEPNPSVTQFVSR